MFSHTLLILATFLNPGAPDASGNASGNASTDNASTWRAPVGHAPIAQVPAPQQAGTHHVNESRVPAAPASKRRARVATRLSADEVVAKVQDFYLQTQHLTALFRQTYTNSTFGKTSVSDGKMWIKKPGKMRWDYVKKGKKKQVSKSFISNGTLLWAVEHDNKQITRTKIADNILPVAVSFLFGKGDLARDFAAELDTSGTYEHDKEYVLKLTPRKPSAQYKTLYLVVAPDNFRVKQSIVVEASDNINHFRFFLPDTEKNVEDSWFNLNIKKSKKLRKYRLITPQKNTKKKK